MTENVYSAPASAEIESTGDYAEAIIFTFGGRLGRMRFIAYYYVFLLCIFLGAAAIGVYIALSGDAATVSEGGSSTSMVVGYVVQLIYLAFLVTLIMRRLRDFNLSAWWVLVFVFFGTYQYIPALVTILPWWLPALNLLALILLGAVPGTAGTNLYGPPQPPNSIGVKIAFWAWVATIALIIYLVIAFNSLIAEYVKAVSALPEILRAQ